MNRIALKRTRCERPPTLGSAASEAIEQGCGMETGQGLLICETALSA